MNPKILAFLAMVAKSEGTFDHPLTKCSGYDVIVTGDVAAGEIGQEVFTNFSYHPFSLGRKSKIIRTEPEILRSSASGRYQIELFIWKSYSTGYGLTNFSSASQDKVCYELIRERGGVPLILAGSIESAIAKCNPIWASLPGSPINQPHTKMADLVQFYNEQLQGGNQ